ncbi:hypothetical protein GCM10028775_73250 [Catellatospora paridis]
MMTADQFVAYARRQIAAAEQILSEHARLGPGMCSCGRSWPCPVAVSCAQMRDHYAAKAALVEATQVLPVVRRDRPYCNGHWRRLVGLLSRLTRRWGAGT